MCSRTNKLELCSCTDMSVKRIQQLYSEEIKLLGRKEILKVIRWKLKKHVGQEWNGMDGLMIMPSENLTQELSEKRILNDLNQTNCFDFDYIPNNGDNLIFEIGWLFNRWGKRINKKIEYEYSSFIFKDEKWVADSYNGFYEKTEIIKEGIIKNVTLQNV